MKSSFRKIQLNLRAIVIVGYTVYICIQIKFKDINNKDKQKKTQKKDFLMSRDRKLFQNGTPRITLKPPRVR